MPLRQRSLLLSETWNLWLLNFIKLLMHLGWMFCSLKPQSKQEPLTIYHDGFLGIYALVFISGCMSLMFPTIFGMGITGLGKDTKIGGAGMVMAIAGAAVLTQIQGVVSDQAGSIKFAYWVPAIAFLVIAYYSFFVFREAKD